jgi:hypothetical protein
MSEQARPLVLKISGLHKEVDALAKQICELPLALGIHIHLEEALNSLAMATDAANVAYNQVESFSSASRAIGDGEVPNMDAEPAEDEHVRIRDFTGGIPNFEPSPVTYTATDEVVNEFREVRQSVLSKIGSYFDKQEIGEFKSITEIANATDVSEAHVFMTLFPETGVLRNLPANVEAGLEAGTNKSNDMRGAWRVQ